MKRGILILEKAELEELCKYYDINKDPESTLSIKLKAALDTIQQSNSISVSSDELECIMDEIGFVDDDRPLLKHTMSKIAITLANFNDQNY